MNRISFPEYDRENLDKELRSIMQEKTSIPPQVTEAKEEAFMKIRKQSMEKGRKKHHYLTRTFAGLAAGAAVFSGICIANPAFASKVPLVGHVFEQLGHSLGYSGDYEPYAKPLQEEAAVTENGTEGQEKNAYTQTVNGVTVELSEIYCNEKAMYLSMVLSSEGKFPDTMVDQFGVPVISLGGGSRMTFSYNEDMDTLTVPYLDGKFVDDHTYAGVLRVDLTPTLIRYSEPDTGEATVDSQLESEAISLPENFEVKLHIDKLVGNLPESGYPPMPEDLRQKYEQAMAEHGLSTEESAFADFTDEQKEIEKDLRTQMMNAYDEKYPEAKEYPNRYENWWFDGSWDFDFKAAVDHSQTQMKEVNTDGKCDIGKIQVTRTPFELNLSYDMNKAKGYFVTLLDAEGKPLENGHFGGSVDDLAIDGHDVSKVTVYVCDEAEYMDELKGYWYSEDYEEKAGTKTYQELLDERSLFHETVEF